MESYGSEQISAWSLSLEQFVDKRDHEATERLARELQGIGGRALRKSVAQQLLARSERKASYLGDLGYWKTFD